MTTVIVGVEDSDRSRDAIAFARMLAGASRARIILANAYARPLLTSHVVLAEPDECFEAAAEATLAKLRVETGDADGDVEIRALAHSSPAAALQGLAEAEDAALIVIGSSARGEIGRVLAGTTAERLLHGSPCPVAVVPSGFRARAGAIRRILVAYDPSEEAKAALHAAVAVAQPRHASVEAVHVIEPTYSGAVALGRAPAYYVPPEDLVRRARTELKAELGNLEDGERVRTEVVLGDAVSELARRSESADLIVTGSRGYGPHRAVLLGSVSGRLVRKSACPVLVLPRGDGTRVAETVGFAGAPTA